MSEVVKDCLTCGNNDADVCCSCVAKTVGKNDYPLWEKKDK